MSIFLAGTILLVSTSTAWLVTRGIIPWLREMAIDVPNLRSSHRVPTPRGGGIGIIAGVASGLLLGWFFQVTVLNWKVVLATTLIAAVGLAEDLLHGLSIVSRLLIQFLAAAIIILPGEGFSRLPLPEPFNVELGVLGIPLALLWLVGVTNIFNFLDGIDGFAASQGLVGGLALGTLWLDNGPALAAFAVAGGCAGFLIHNWHPARVFMGDVGSSTLGFLFATLPLQLNSGRQSKMVFFTTLCLWFFLSDAIFTLFRRLVRGEKVWQAHRSHLYQRLVISGLRHSQVVIRVMGGATLLSGVVLASSWSGSRQFEYLLLGLALTGFLFYLGWTHRREAHSINGEKSV